MQMGGGCQKVSALYLKKKLVMWRKGKKKHTTCPSTMSLGHSPRHPSRSPIVPNFHCHADSRRCQQVAVSCCC